MRQPEKNVNSATAPEGDSPKAKAKFLKQSQFYHPIAAILITVVVLYFGAQLLAAFIIGLLMAGAKLVGYEINLSDASAFENSTLVQFGYGVLYSAIAGYLLWLFLRARKLSFSDIGLTRRPKFNDVPLVLIVGVVYFVVLASAIAIIGAVVPGINLEQEQELGFSKEGQSVLGLALVFVGLVVLPPVIEELTARGFLYGNLKAKMSKRTAAIITSVLFGIAHLQLWSDAPPLWVAAIDTTILSFFLIYLREKTGSLWASIFLHGAKNCLAFLVLYVVK